MVNHENGPTVVLGVVVCVSVCVCVCVCVFERERERLPVGCISGCMLKEPLALPDQGVLLAHIRALPLVIYVCAMSKHTHTHAHTHTHILSMYASLMRTLAQTT